MLFIRKANFPSKVKSNRSINHFTGSHRPILFLMWPASQKDLPTPELKPLLWGHYVHGIYECHISKCGYRYSEICVQLKCVFNDYFLRAVFNVYFLHHFRRHQQLDLVANVGHFRKRFDGQNLWDVHPLLPKSFQSELTNNAPQ